MERVVHTRTGAGAAGVAGLSVALLVAVVLQACSPAAPYIKQGQELEAQGRYDEAISLYQSVIASGEVPPDKVRERLQAATDGLAAERANRAMSALDAGQFDQAIALAQEARALSATNARVQAVVRAIVSSQTARASDLQADHRPVEAVAVLDDLLSLVPDDETVKAARDAIADDFSEQLEARMREQDKKGHPGNAFVAALILESLNPGRPELSQQVQIRRRDLIAHYRVPVNLIVKTRPGAYPELSAALADVAFQHPYLEKQHGDAGPGAFRVVLTNLEDSVSEVVENGTATKSVPAGEETVANPRIAELEKERTGLMAQIEQVGDQIDALNAQVERETDIRTANRIRKRLDALSRKYNELGTQYESLSQEIASLPAQIKTVRYHDVSIPVEVHRRTLQLNARYQGHSDRPDFPVNVSYSLWGAATTEAEAYEAFPEYGLPAQSPVYETPDDALRRMAARNLAHKVATTTDTVMNDWLVLELRKARARLAQGDEEGAMESFVRIILGTTTPIPDDVASFLRSRGLLDPSKIRG